MLKNMKYKIVGSLPVHNCDPGSVVEITEEWDVDFLLSTGHIEPAEPAPTKSKSVEDEEI